MYADETVIYVHAKNKVQAALQLPDTMVHVSEWLFRFLSTTKCEKDGLHVFHRDGMKLT